MINVLLLVFSCSSLSMACFIISGNISNIDNVTISSRPQHYTSTTMNNFNNTREYLELFSQYLYSCTLVQFCKIKTLYLVYLSQDS